MALLHVIAFAALSAAAACPVPKDWTVQEWDAIIVGAGTAGIVVADRLSEAGLKTLLLEQGGASYGITGGDEKPHWLSDTALSRVDVPGLYSTIFATPDSSLTCKPDVVSAFQGCTVGGSSAINAGLYFQPPASDWDDYHPKGWHSADVQPAVDRLLERQPPVTDYSSDGETYTADIQNSVRDWIVSGAGYADVSFDQVPDNKENVYGKPVYNYINGQRGGPVRTYLQTALARRNFHFSTGVTVKHIDQKQGKASAVVIETANGATKSIRLSGNGRVVLSAGALLSPKILMYSGIGPKEILASLSQSSHTPYTDSSSWVEQPDVGQGLFDNPNTFITLSDPSISSYKYDYEDPIQEDANSYLQSRSGPYSFASQTGAFWTYIGNEDGSRSGVQGTVSNTGYADYMDNNTITLNIYGTSGLKSSGRVKLSDDGKFTAGPSDDVYYSDPRDAKVIASFIHSLFQALPSSSPDSPAKDGLTPLNLAQNSTAEEIEKYITTPSAYAVGQVNHWSSSCRIGKCVDAYTKVIGTDNIHVVDASIISPMTVNPQFAVMVAGEMGAAKIIGLGRA